MAELREARVYRFGAFEANARTGELRRGGFRIRLHVQPFHLLMLFLNRPGELLTREEICRALWPEGTFVDFEQGLNSAVGRLREALGDRAASPRFVETLARRGYRWVAPVEVVGCDDEVPDRPPDLAAALTAQDRAASLDPANDARASVPAQAEPTGRALPTTGVRWLAQAEDLPRTSVGVVLGCFMALQAMYLAFYVGALANLAEIRDLMSPLPGSAAWFAAVAGLAAAMIPVRLALLCGAAFRTPEFPRKFLRMWPALAAVDSAWALSPLLLLNHISFGLAMACMAPLVYAPFAERSLVLMAAGADPGRRSRTGV